MSEAMIPFRLIQPTNLDEAISALTTEGAQPVSGGTDLLVRLRKGLSETNTLVDLTNIAALKKIEKYENGLRIGAGATLAELERNPDLAEYAAVLQAVQSVAGPTHREAATLGGNLCLDTRCVYYNQSHWWRKSNDFCLKYRGEICHVAPKGNRCRAAFSGDIAPALMVHRALIEIAGPAGVRQIPLAEFYLEDGAVHTVLQQGEIVLAVHLPQPGAASKYGKIRVRGSIDYPLAGVAVACETATDGNRFTLAVTGTNSKPILVDITDPLGDDADTFFAALEKSVQKAVSPQRTTTIAPHYRRLSVSALARRIARQLAQDSK
ncbi:MAG: 4-hydroxybenzoyl-CoA reductase subunit beta [Rhodobacteraceae bacterium]|nr:4-hydroxybenzoyl-CoA reductase subunit beta [Paracoccaceae bacterium]